MEQSLYSLKHPYISIKTSEDISCGGNQKWFRNKKLKQAGCGVIAAGDMLLYMALTNQNCDTDLFHHILREDGKISYTRYERYIQKLRQRYFFILPFLGIPVWALPISINRYFHHYDLPYRASWNILPSNFVDRIQGMLREDIPVIISIGQTFPMFFSKQKVTLYTQTNGVFYPETAVKGHYVVVTGIEHNFLQISSWGKEYYISLEEYKLFARKHSNFFFSNLCYIKKKKSRRYK